METYTIQIKDDKAIKILQSLRDAEMIDYCEEKKTDKNRKELSKLKPKNKSEDESFFDLAGIWKDKDISIDIIREKAWPQRK